MAHAHTASPTAFDELDPHSTQAHGQHASHVIVGPFTLRSILAILLLLTALTVGLAQFEVWVEQALGIVLPWWVNVAVAMSIAIVKSVMVMAFFMQLKYDNPINTLLMLFCFFSLGLFLLFTGLDLFSRGAITSYKSGPVIAGGTSRGIVTANNLPVTEASKLRLKDQLADGNIKEWVIIATAIQAAAHELTASDHGGNQRVKEGATTQPPVNQNSIAAKALSNHANRMLDLHVVKLHPPTGPSQALVTKEIAAIADSLRAAGNPDAADLVLATSRNIATLDMQQAKAAYSIDAAFINMANVAHGEVHHAHAGQESDGNTSRAKSGISRALDDGRTSHGYKANPHAANTPSPETK